MEGILPVDVAVEALLAIGGILVLCMSVAVRDGCFAWTAHRLGDSSAKLLGRVTLNPAKHLDLFGTILLPLALLFATGLAFGCGRVMPLQAYRLRRPSRDIFIVAIAGPLASLTIALGLALVLLLSSRFDLLRPDNLGYLFLMQAIWTNVLLCLVHLVPLPPLDASRLLSHFLPPRIRLSFDSIGMYGMLLFIALFFSPFGAVLKEETESLPVWFRLVAQLVIP